MLDVNLQDLLNARDVEDYKSCVVRFAQGMGFGTMDAMTVLDDRAGNSEFIRVENIDNPNWAAIDPAYGRRDPVMQHLKRSSYPIIWSSANYLEPSVAEGYEVVASMGLRSGISIASHFADGRHFVLSVHTNKDLSRSSRQFARALPQLESYAVYALDAAFRLLMPAERSNVGELAMREIEALRYVSDGWSSRMVASRFNLGESICERWLRSVAAKLDCRDFRHAALKARRIGIFR